MPLPPQVVHWLAIDGYTFLDGHSSFEEEKCPARKIEGTPAIAGIKKLSYK